MNDTSAITGNGNSGWSLGVANFGDLTMNDASSITRHRKGLGGTGVSMAPGSTFTMSGSSVIRDNDQGVTVYVNSALSRGRTLTMSGSSVIRDNDYGLFFSPDDTLVGVVCAPNELANVIGNSSADCTTG